jgi:hypothetical protein
VISGAIPAKFRGIPRNFAEFRRNCAEITSEVKKFRGIPCRRNSVDTLDTEGDPDPDPSIFTIDLLDANKNLIKKSFLHITILLEGTFTSFFKDKKSKKSHTTVEIKVFLTILLNDRRIRIWSRIHTSD